MLNIEGYYNSLLTLFDKGVEEGFIKPGARDIVLSAPTANELLRKMEVLSAVPTLFDFLSNYNNLGSLLSRLDCVRETSSLSCRFNGLYSLS